MKKHLKSNWTIYTIGAFGGLIASFKPDYWWVHIVVFGIVVGAIDTYFTPVSYTHITLPTSDLV